MTSDEMDPLCVNTIRFLSVDMVEKANSGHPGLPMGAAPMAYVLWTRFLRHSPKNPGWWGRDRFERSSVEGQKRNHEEARVDLKELHRKHGQSVWLEGRVVWEKGETVPAENVIWAAGVSASPLTPKLGVELDGAGRVKVNLDLSVPGYPEAFAIGDMALVLGADGKPVPGVSPAAM